MSTPEITDISKNKFSPLGSGISKNLLTPCRRIGLSRKRKTPNSIKIGSEDLNSSNNSLTDNSFIETTPVLHRKSTLGRRKNKVPNLHSSPSTADSDTEKEKKVYSKSDDSLFEKETFPKGYLFKKFSSEDLFNSETDLPPMDIQKQPTHIQENTDMPINTEGLSNTVQENICSKRSKRSLRRLSSDDLSFENITPKDHKPDLQENLKPDYLENEIIVIDDFDDSKINTCNSKQKPQSIDILKSQKELKKTLCIKNSSTSTSDDEFQSDFKTKANNVKQCKVKLKRLSDDQLGNADNKTNVSCKISVNKHNSTIVDEDDDFTYTPDQEKTEKKNLRRKIKVLEEQIKQKQQRHANLKQALIYKNKHNIGDLKELTSKWKDGCVMALNDLLSQLKAHGPMDMSTLINNLHIPKEIVTELALNIE